MQCRIPRKNVPLLPPIVQIVATYWYANNLNTTAIRGARSEFLNATRGWSIYVPSSIYESSSENIECYKGDRVIFYTNVKNTDEENNPNWTSELKKMTQITLNGTTVASGTEFQTARYEMTITSPIKIYCSINSAVSSSAFAYGTIKITTT